MQVAYPPPWLGGAEEGQNTRYYAYFLMPKAGDNTLGLLGPLGCLKATFVTFFKQTIHSIFKVAEGKFRIWVPGPHFSRNSVIYADILYSFRLSDAKSFRLSDAKSFARIRLESV